MPDTDFTPVPKTIAGGMSGDVSQLIEALKASDAKIGGIRKAQQAATAPIESGISAKAKEMAATPTPKLDAVPGKFQHQGMNDQQMTEAMQTMFAFAAIGGALTRTPMTTALNAFSAGIKGLAQGDQITFQRQIGVFRVNSQNAIAKNNQMIQEYDLAFKKNQTDVNLLTTELGLINKKYGNTMADAILERGGAVELAKYQANARKATQQFEIQMKRFDLLIGRMGQTDRRLEQGDRRLDILQQGADQRGAAGGRAGAKAPSTTDIKTATSVIEGDKRFEKMDDAEKKAFASYVASQAKALVGNKTAEDYGEGVDMAIENLIKQGRLKPGEKRPWYQPDKGASFGPASATPAAPAVAKPATSYQSADDVKAAVQSGALDREAGIKLLKDQFGFTD